MILAIVQWQQSAALTAPEMALICQDSLLD
jgi:hypothetical protein